MCEARTKAQAGCYVGGAHPSVEWACAGPRVLQMVFRANSRGFTNIWLGRLDRLHMALQESMTLGPGAVGIWTWAKRVDPEHLCQTRVS